MEPHEENRRYQRYELKSPMSLHRMDYQDQYYYAEMNDYSQGGLSMMTNEKLVIGQLVYLEMQNHNKHTTFSDKNKNIGIVRWAKPNPSTNGGTNALYKYGVEYSGSSGYHC
ncbi:MAG: PilZ domain-containing protein [Pseudomonadota bacterium]